jgi:uncharacterized protein (UPF0548 family)
VFCIAKPSSDSIRTFISAQKSQPFSYSEVGCSRGQAPNGYTADHNRIQLGLGFPTFERAKSAIREWKMFEIPWIELCWPHTPIESGCIVALLASHFGFWSLNACRIVYVMEEHEPLERYGFAYGTLPQHGAIGEERFTVEYNPDDESVTYDIYAISRLRLAGRIAYPFARNLQKRFARDSKIAMQKCV